jgi:hypothetical protein
LTAQEIIMSPLATTKLVITLEGVPSEIEALDVNEYTPVAQVSVLCVQKQAWHD